MADVAIILTSIPSLYPENPLRPLRKTRKNEIRDKARAKR